MTFQIARMALTKAGGAYIPPHRLRAIMGETAALQGNASPEFQRLSWDALRKSINGLINKVNVANIKQIVPELFQENLIRARGLYCRSIMRAQAASLPFTPVFAALTAIINTKLPQVGELLLTRLVSQFRRSFKRNDKPSCVATSTFIAQLVNQQVAHELLVLQMLVLLLEHPTGDSVEIAVGLMREVGAFLAEAAPKANNGVFERFRAILHEGQVEKRVQYMIEVLFQVRREKFKDNPIIPEGLDLVEEDDMITHRISLDDELVTQDTLNIFKFDPNFLENEEKYKEMKREILGDSDEESGSGSEESGSEEDDDEDEEDVETGIAADGTVQIHDQTETNMVNLRRTIYLTIMSALDFEEAVHKLLKMQLPPGKESELCNMVIECCSQERSYNKFYGLMAERLCKINRVWSIGFEGCFRTYYDTIHRYETNRLRNIAKLFGHLLASDGIPWSCLDVIRMTEDDTTSSSRIFTKIMFQEMLEEMGLPKLKRKLFEDAALQPFLEGIFPKDHPKNTRFSINFFTSIGLGALTEDMREHLKVSICTC
ncbi:MIF4G-domain-containing protein [Cystobasidium minutum MCA 4210]|uniref:MIF4G-domain-containing protein n=1 Tax=Cystobasidium minutum MCA 4210 TaxID=1397322 RepID=UPI0034CD05ED|eukprot:jgi/Rhomi1/146431/e_gw1.6.248.1